MKKDVKAYKGFELGAIRPPSEARSLLLRVTRNCPYNKCTFCGLYKGEKFSIRLKEHVLRDIDLIKRCVDILKESNNKSELNRYERVNKFEKELDKNFNRAYKSALSWYRGGMESVFLQDANSLIIKPHDMVEILTYIREKFPEVKRITTYARSHTVAKIKDEDLRKFKEAGLNRIHIGMESAADEVLKLVKKGVDKKTHIIAGKKVKKAGIQLSEYFMPGLGGNEYSKEHVLETSDALNKINPDFIRIRTLAVTDKSPLAKDYEEGIFTRTNDEVMVNELLLLLKNLKGITSTIKSDHILNLIQEIEGVLPQDKEEMISNLQWFLNLNKKEKMIFKLGRRMGIISSMKDLYNNSKRLRVKNIIKKNNISINNIDLVVDNLMKRYI
ncbi:MAG: radical SAM protein [Firmicutes bacterium]|nr:radical SAM protein [Bacillota bacterium]